MIPKKTLAGFGATAMLMSGVDASVLAVEPIERYEVVAQELVESKQVGNVVETTLPWKDQAGIKVKYDMGEPTIAEKLADKRKEQVVTELIDFGEGGYKIDIVLNEKPNRNVFCYAIEGAENYDFFYQPPLTADEIADGNERPEDIVGSYAVYHKTLKNHREGAENYATGKVMHIPRPQVWELNNQASTTEWANLSYTEKDGLCVTVRQEFLDNAIYPVRVDPTFGYTTVGVSGTRSAGISDALVAEYNLTEAGDITSVSYRVSTQSSDNTKGLIYSDGGTEPASFLASGDVQLASVNNTWYTSNLTYTASAADYWIGLVVNSSAVSIPYDTATGEARIDFGHNYTDPSLEATWNTGADTADTGRKYSIYATYTASGGGGGSATTTGGMISYD